MADPAFTSEAEVKAWLQKTLTKLGKEEEALAKWLHLLMERYNIGLLTCDDAESYNQAAKRLFMTQDFLYRKFLAAGVQIQGPNPPTFIAKSARISLSPGDDFPAIAWEPACFGDGFVATGMIQNLSRQPCPPGTPQGLGIAPVVVGIWALSAVAVLMASTLFVRELGRQFSGADKNMVDNDIDQSVTQDNLALEEKRQRCLEKGFASVTPGLSPDQAEAVKRDIRKRCDENLPSRGYASRGKGLFWWLGAIAVVGGATWGGVWLYRRHKASQGRRSLPRH